MEKPEINIVVTFRKLADQSIELYLTPEGWMMYDILLAEYQAEKQQTEASSPPLPIQSEKVDGMTA